MNRGVIRTNLADGELQDWGDTGSFFNTDVCNPYVKFFHQKDISSTVIPMPSHTMTHLTKVQHVSPVIQNVPW